MLYKIALKNMKKSIKDYAIYFLTLVLGVSIFYMFNSLDSQQAMLEVSQSTKSFIKIMIDLLGVVSVFVAVVLGLLIVYANNYLINRRKKEFGTYMILGMGKRQISRIIIIETIFVGIASLFVGIIVGVFASQFMSILVAKLFSSNMSEYTFVFSKAACIKTCVYFSIMYLAVMVFNTVTISKYKLINLLTAIKKNEKVTLKNPIISAIVFIISIAILIFAYYKVTIDASSLRTAKDMLKVIVIGIVATILFFWSLSGFILQVIQKAKKVYLNGTNMFILRQLNNKINTMVISMSVICIMLFMAITILSTALSIRNTMERNIKEMTPVDLFLEKTANLPEKYMRYGKEIVNEKEQIEDSKRKISYTLMDAGFDMNLLTDVIEINTYSTNDLTWSVFLNNKLNEIKEAYPMLMYDTAEVIIKVSDYNKVARLYKVQEYELEEDEYIVLCDFESMKAIRNDVLKDSNNILTICGKQYKSKYSECKSGYVEMAGGHVNTGIILVPDTCSLTEDIKEKHLLIANYNAKSKEDKAKIEEILASNESNIIQELSRKGYEIDGMTKITVTEASSGLTTTITFIAIYLGIIFVIASSVILALKQLTESSDNKQRYTILRKIGCDEKMINKSLFIQILIFFAMPLILAVVHSIFGIQFGITLMSGLASAQELVPSIIVTVAIMGVIYGAYFFATYFQSKNIIREI